ncbi:hypothetical protein V2J09_015256 [Rumex salicifolius]
MASPPILVEDQTDEDFFDKLVEDEGDVSGSGPTFEEHLESDDVLAFEKLRIGEVGKPEDVLDSFGGFEGAIGDNCVEEDVASGSLLPDSVNIATDPAAVMSSKEDRNQCTDEPDNDMEKVTGSLDLDPMVLDGENVTGDSEVLSERNVAGGVKEVQWDAFNSFGEVTETSAFGSDIFGGIEGNIEDSFREVVENHAFGLGGTNDVSSTAFDSPSLSNSVQNTENLSNGVYTENGSYAAHGQNQVGLTYTENTSEVQDVNSIEYWESLYPGWKYDPNTGQWHPEDSSNLIGNDQVNDSVISQSAGDVYASEQQSSAYHLQQTTPSAVGNVIQGSASENVAYWNQTSGETHEYPQNMVFDAQYPGWYYDTAAQEWRSLESYTASINQKQTRDQNQLLQNGSDAMVHHQANNATYGQHCHDQNQDVNWGVSVNEYSDLSTNSWDNQPLSNMQHVDSTANTLSMKGHVQSGHMEGFVDNSGFMVPSSASSDSSQGFDGSKGISGFQSFVPDQRGHAIDSTNSRNSFVAPTTATFSDHSSQGFNGNNGISGFQGFVPAQKFTTNQNDYNKGFNYQPQFSPTPFYSADFSNLSNQPPVRDSQIPSTPVDGRSPDGRPPHALVAFGFGGKLIVMKKSAGPVVNVLNMMDIVVPKSEGVDVVAAGSDYFNALCNQSFPGPLVSGNVGNKELNKWIDDRVANSGSQETNFAKADVTRVLFSLLKIACQYYGKMRTPFGTDNTLKESDCPESALVKLFASAKGNNTQLTQYGGITSCLQTLPSEEQIQATALDVEKLLVTGRRMEALQCAQEGQLWGPAIVIAAQLGDRFYSETVKQMAINQLVSGCPLRTLCLLIAGQPAEVFSNSTMNNNHSSSLNVSQATQMGSNCMLDNWEENLAIITANRTKGDELVITHLGDCLWKERSEVISAHICYLIAEMNIETYSDSSRLCLIGADHWKNPRTFVTPEAIQRTELFEYSKVLGNSQFILLPFQPYKLAYAHMLAEVGKLSDSLKYCQAIMKSLKTGRAPEVDAWRNLVSSLEERIKISQQGGYTANLAPAKLVGKLLNFFDSTAQRVVGLPPAAPSVSSSNGQHHENDYRVSASQSTMAMSSLTSSASLEPINEWSGSSNRKLHNRSVSEPDISRKDRSSDKSTSSSSQDNKGSTVGPSRLGRFSSRIFQKTVGLVLRSGSERQAKLGETNKFYYDEKLKRWVEEGAAPPAEEPALAPPPTTASFINGFPDQHMNDGALTPPLHQNTEQQFKSPDPPERSSVMPPISPATNQYSSRARMGVRARYVDTFNKGGGAATNSFQSPSLPAAKPAGFSNAKFFVPTPAPAGEQLSQVSESKTEPSMGEIASNDQSNSFPPIPLEPQMTAPTVQMQRYPSQENLVANNKGMVPNRSSPPLQNTRRTASWSGVNYADVMAHSNNVGPQPHHGEALGHPPYMPNGQFQGNSAEDLQDVEL